MEHSKTTTTTPTFRHVRLAVPWPLLYPDDPLLTGGLIVDSQVSNEPIPDEAEGYPCWVIHFTDLTAEESERQEARILNAITAGVLPWEHEEGWTHHEPTP